MSVSKLRERILLTLVEELNKTNMSEPENSIPAFLERACARLEELCMDEARYGDRKA
jgi:hypothetical protein